MSDEPIRYKTLDELEADKDLLYTENKRLRAQLAALKAQSWDKEKDVMLVETTDLDNLYNYHEGRFEMLKLAEGGMMEDLGPCEEYPGHKNADGYGWQRYQGK